MAMALAWAGLAWGSETAPASQAAPAAPPPRRLVVGTATAEPFAFKGPDGRWAGITMDIWDRVAKQMGVEYEVREMTLSDLLRAVSLGQVDVAATALSVTPEREKVMDFSQPYFFTGLGVAMAAKAHSSWLDILDQVLSSRPVAILLVVLSSLLLAGLVIHLAERRRNREQFGGSLWHGLGSGLWWAAQTLTSVGYGDKAPVTPLGRLLACIWMVISLVLITSFTAVITTSLTVSHLGINQRDSSELRSLRVGVVQDSSAQTYLEFNHVGSKAYPGMDQVLTELAEGHLDAVVADGPVLRYMAAHEFKGKIAVQRDNFQPGIYALALPNGSPWRKPLNLALMAKLQEDSWRQTLFRYLGDDPEIRDFLRRR
jgi:ABC-type amino acid transport substrate-binding protein